MFRDKDITLVVACAEPPWRHNNVFSVQTNMDKPFSYWVTFSGAGFGCMRSAPLTSHIETKASILPIWRTWLRKRRFRPPYLYNIIFATLLSTILDCTCFISTLHFTRRGFWNKRSHTWYLGGQNKANVWKYAHLLRCSYRTLIYSIMILQR